MDNLVRHLTELGITEWIPFIAERSVSRPDKKRLASRMERWKKIAREAVKQCKRSHIPDIDTVLSFEELLHIGKAYDLKIVFWENETMNFAFPQLHDKQYHTIFVMLGPEGGFTSREIESALASGFVTAALGPRILRAETATIAASALLQYLFGDMG
ncbi:Ribosomal RNA small subunit methyltransferase E domain-containing protein [Desulfonema magnum]|uniref:16S rRNA (uracil(1498)-N(3))-methyltransferase n=1 Tax=Desulfonema magnum TaxID=45655 RepID=A0A975GSA8_9BACT|nr:Ribosomal RNA small subunit methyltransferase E domain-containing protein [Desulfonema magnum]